MVKSTLVRQQDVSTFYRFESCPDHIVTHFEMIYRWVKILTKSEDFCIYKKGRVKLLG